jgi:hypothetical protein
MHLRGWLAKANVPVTVPGTLNIKKRRQEDDKRYEKGKSIKSAPQKRSFRKWKDQTGHR